jgi:hypothetical protein
LRANSQIAASSSAGIEVPVGFDGVAIMMPRVRSVHLDRTDAASN